MRGMFSTHRVPLAAIDTVVVTQVLAVKVGDQRFVSPVIGYTVRQTMKAQGARRAGADRRRSGPAQDHQAFVEARIAYVAQDARDRLGIRKGSPEQQALAADVRRTWAWPEIVGVRAARAGVRGLAARLAVARQMPAAALMPLRSASRRPTAAIRAASTPSSGSTGTTTSR